ncbi:S9 family peptidase [Bacteroidales bacterium OttesenSCG-928-B11]|nr:S9 family peptidase [Bacteroidales bacterium OttesenSCG-928-B11]
MRKYAFLTILWLCAFTLSAQNKSIDLQGVFTGKYQIDNYLSLAWRPQTTQFTFSKSSSYDTLFIQGANDKTAKMFLTKTQLQELLPDKKIRSVMPYEWIDQNTLYFPNLKALLTIDKNKFQAKVFPLDGKKIIDYDVKNALFITKDDNGYVFVLSEKNGYTPILLSTDTGANIVFGESVHRSEWGINEGQYISPSGKYIAFYRMDENMVEAYPLVHANSSLAKVEMIRYPMAGQKSHRVQVGIFNVEESAAQNKPVYHYIKTEFLDGEFLTNVTFSPSEMFLYITHVNREQNQMKLIEYDLLTGEKERVVISERDDRYVEPQNPPLFLKNDRFIWQTRRDGWNHCYLYDISGDMIKQLTKGNYEIINLIGVDPQEENLYFISNKDDFMGRFTYKLNMKSETLTNLTLENGTHTPLFSSNYQCLLDKFNNTTTPLEINLFDLKKQKKTNLLTAKNPYTGLSLGETKLFTIKNDEHIDLCCRMIYPPNFDEKKKYPVFVYVYGGPHSQLVTNTFMSGGVFLHYMAQQGYIVFTLDNRGTANRGAEFEKCIHRNLGVLEVKDQMTGVNYLKSLPYVDVSKIGVDGWSYGGFMTLSLVTDHPDIFKSASCGGPVVDWKWYEVMYGERYMDTPEENPTGYNNSSIIPKIKNLQCDLLVMHGALDNTVVQQHSLELLRQSIADGVQIEYFVYPTHEHNVRGLERVHLWEKIEKFHNRNLKSITN